jgi:four helix bundle protein
MNDELSPSREEVRGGVVARRAIDYSLRIIRLCQTLRTDEVGRTLGRQLLRSATSIGANIQEAQSAQSKPDFVAKMSIAQKEARESAYWLLLTSEARLLPADRLESLRAETDEVIRIITAIIISTKKNRKLGRIHHS